MYYLGDGTLKRMNKFQEKRANTGIFKSHMEYKMKVAVHFL